MSRRQRRTREKQARHAPRRVVASGGLALAVSLVSGSVADAATLHVESNGDTQGMSSCDVGDGCTLRDALTNAGDGDTIVFNSSLSGSTIGLGGALPTPTPTDGSLTIDGSGAPGLTVEGYSSHAIFRFDTTGTIAISDLHLHAGFGSGTGGGAVNSTGTGPLQLSSMDINDSNAVGGSGAVHAHGPLTIMDSDLANNINYGYEHGPFNGGAVAADDELTISGSSFHDNYSSNGGGAIYATGAGAVTIDNTTLYHNHTYLGYYYGTRGGSTGGGAIRINAANSPVTITGSTIVGNHVESYYYPASGGGIWVANTGAYTPQIDDTVVSGNSVSSGIGGGGGQDLRGTFDTSFSLIGTRGGATILSSDHDLPDGTDPLLNGFGADGTNTLNPKPTSPLLDAGSSFGLTTDQRGMTRPFDLPVANATDSDATDIGAVELHPPPPSGGPAATALPVVTAISPSGGPAGTSVGISGENFGQVTGVLFGSTAATFVVDNGNHITAVAPPGVSGAVDVTVVNARGTSSTSAADRFTYAAAAAGPGPGPGAPPIPGPPLATALDRIRFGSNRDRTLHDLALHGIVVHVTCDPGPCAVVTTLRQNGHAVGHTTKTVRKGENIAVRTRLSDSGLDWLRIHPVGIDPGHLRLRVTLVDGTDHLARVGRYSFTR
jgi:predicted outer membrane repeat protein